MNSAFSLHSVFGDHMVVQRDKPIRIAGTAQPQATIHGRFRANDVTVTADSATGEWVMEFRPCEAGGPYTIALDCNGTSIIINDVMVGEVWLCSGQSNMEFYVWREGGGFYCLRDGEKVAAEAHDDGLRLLQITHGLNLDGPCSEFPGRPSWKPATTPETVADFSAVAYWFGVTLRKHLGGNVPVGLINASWGGALIEPWMPRFAFEELGSEYILKQLDEATSIDLSKDAADVVKIHKEMLQKTLDDWVNNKYLQSDPAASADALANWAKLDLNESTWHKGPRAHMVGSSKVGATWYRFHFDIPEKDAGRNLILNIDAIDDADQSFVDGVKVGQTMQDVPFCWQVRRQYKIGKLAAGHHVVAIRHFNFFNVGIVSGAISIIPEDEGDDFTINLGDGEWMERVEFHADVEKIGTRPVPPSAEGELFPRNNFQTPTILFNAEINPATYTNAAGMIWYQGCSNSSAPDKYRVYQKKFIEVLRRLWRDDKFAFISTQLSAFREHHPENRSPDDWWKNDTPISNFGYAHFRKMQEEFLDIPGSGVACTIDIGDHSDIHPANKKDVGIRLAHEAMRVRYGHDEYIAGPRFGSAKQEGNAIRVSFRNVGDGLVVDDGAFAPHLWSVAGEDDVHYWAEAKLLSDNTVVVSCPEVPLPKHVRYAYSACPSANFRRKGDGLPVFPFDE